MSPLEIMMLLSVYCRGRDYRDEASPEHAASCAVRATFARFVKEDLIEPCFTDAQWQAIPPAHRFSQYQLLPRGAALCAALMAVEFPIYKWVQP